MPTQPARTAGGFSLPLAAGAQSTTFIVQRQAAGDFRVEFAVVDACHGTAGPFRTFVGGGKDVR
jgi:hypothetical protein